MQLKNCTKKELLWIIQAMCRYDLTDRHLRLALDDLQYERERDRLDRAHQLLQVSSAASQRYAELVRPYEGIPLADVPMEVLQEADAALDEFNTANKEWRKLMGVKAK